MGLVVKKLHSEAVVPDARLMYLTALSDPMKNGNLVTYRTGLSISCDSDHTFSVYPVNSLAGTGMIMVNCNTPMTDTNGELLIIFRIVDGGNPYVKGDHIAYLQVHDKLVVKIKVNE